MVHEPQKRHRNMTYGLERRHRQTLSPKPWTLNPKPYTLIPRNVITTARKLWGRGNLRPLWAITLGHPRAPPGAPLGPQQPYFPVFTVKHHRGSINPGGQTPGFGIYCFQIGSKVPGVTPGQPLVNDPPWYNIKNQTRRDERLMKSFFKLSSLPLTR